MLQILFITTITMILATCLSSPSFWYNIFVRKTIYENKTHKGVLKKYPTSHLIFHLECTWLYSFLLILFIYCVAKAVFPLTYTYWAYPLFFSFATEIKLDSLPIYYTNFSKLEYTILKILSKLAFVLFIFMFFEFCMLEVM